MSDLTPATKEDKHRVTEAMQNLAAWAEEKNIEDGTHEHHGLFVRIARHFWHDTRAVFVSRYEDGSGTLAQDNDGLGHTAGISTPQEADEAIAALEKVKA